MVENSIKSVIEAESDELKKLTESLDYDVVNTLIKKIQNNKGNIFVTGCGTSAMAAKKIVHTMQVVNQRIFYLNPSDAVHGGIGAIEKDDIPKLIGFLNKQEQNGKYFSTAMGVKETNVNSNK